MAVTRKPARGGEKLRRRVGELEALIAARRAKGEPRSPFIEQRLAQARAALARALATSDGTARLQQRVNELERLVAQRSAAGEPPSAFIEGKLTEARRALAEATSGGNSGGAPEILTRAQWGAAPTRGTLSANTALREVVLHHTAFPMAKIAGGRTLAAESAHMREMQRWHFGRKFCDLGYHFVVSPSGRVFLGRPIDRMGAHVLNANQGTIGISLMGNFQEEQPTQAALASIAFVRGQLIPGGLKLPLKGHRDYPGHETNECPGRHLYAYTKQH